MIFIDAENLSGPAGPTTPEAIREEGRRQAEAVQALRLMLRDTGFAGQVAAVRILN
jgi:hypothetical protein